MSLLSHQTDLRRQELQEEINSLLKEFSSRPENKGFEANMEDDSIWFIVDASLAHRTLRILSLPHEKEPLQE
jgi:hypothetical protein